MAQCINKNLVEYQILKLRSGITNTKVLDAICSIYLETFDRFPRLDEISSNSEPHLKEFIKLDSNNNADILTILDKTKSSSIEEANSWINDKYADLEVSINPMYKKAKINVIHRPTFINAGREVEVETTLFTNSTVSINKALDKLSRLYGINYIPISVDEINMTNINKIYPEATSTAAFILNGNIYINTDIASIDAPTHEFLHLLIGGLKFKNRELYDLLVNQARNFEDYDYRRSEFPNRTISDFNEELFISELAKYLTGQPSELMNLDKKLLKEITYNIYRIFDTILMGNVTTKTKSILELLDMSLIDIAKSVESDSFTNFSKLAYDNRTLSNIKSELFKNKELEEICD